jgi:RHS repeat-associated protein
MMVSYTYDADGNRATIIYPDGTVVTNGYTARNQLASVTADGPPPLATYAYDLNGNRTAKTLENNTSVSYVYDDANRLLSITNKTGSTPFASVMYGYNSMNNRTFVKRETGKGDVYRYDPTDQVTNVLYEATNPDSTPSSPERTVGYVYDAVGNRNSLTDNGSTTNYMVNNLNQYTAVGSDPLSYDANGNLTDASGWAYTYDAQNRLVAASGGSGGTNSASLAYDARNRCVQRVINAATNYLHYSDWNLIDERNGSGTQFAEYVHGATIDEILVTVISTNAYYHHHDALGSVTHVADASGAVAEMYSYDIFGAATIKDAGGTNLPVSAIGNRFLFTGREYLSDLALYDYRNRFFSHVLGRFLHSDPARFSAADVNLYRYVHNDVLNSTDPTGLMDWIWPLNGQVNNHSSQCVSVVDIDNGFVFQVGPGEETSSSLDVDYVYVNGTWYHIGPWNFDVDADGNPDDGFSPASESELQDILNILDGPPPESCPCDY